MKITNSKDEMIENQLILRGISNKKVIEAFRSVPREYFVRKEDSNKAYIDSALPIECGQTISQPYIVALMVELIDPKKNDTIVEIGSGCGYMVAILSCIVEKVYGVEIENELVNISKKNLEKINANNVEIKYEDGKELFSFEKESIDKIIISAATKEIPKEWIEVLKEEGKIVVPIDKNNYQTIKVYVKKENKLVEIYESFPVRFVKLR